MGYSSYLFCASRGKGIERAAPVHTLVQKVRAGEQFLARGRVHRRKTHPVGVLAFFYFVVRHDKKVNRWLIFALQPAVACISNSIMVVYAK